MNLLHLKYVIEVAKAGSISKAASNLYMNQPHLSKTIKDLEENNSYICIAFIYFFNRIKRISFSIIHANIFISKINH